MYDEVTYEAMYSIPTPSKIGVFVAVPFSVARHVNCVAACGKTTVWPTYTCLQVVPPSFEISTLMLVPVGVYPMMLLMNNVSIDLDVVNEVPTMVAEVPVWLRSSNSEPSPK